MTIKGFARAVLISTVFILSACISVQQPAPTGNNLSEITGAWAGYLDQFSNKYLPDDDGDPVYEVVILNCTGSPEIWLKSDDTGYWKIYGNYNVRSKAGNHILSLIVEGDGWVETQIWALVVLTDTTADIQWSRMVSNPQLSAEEDLRSFGKLGYGELKKVSDRCDIFKGS